MSIKRVLLGDGSARWEARIRESGRGSRQLCKRFETKIEAENFLTEVSKQKVDNRRSGIDADTFEETTFADEARFWVERRGLEFSPAYKKKANGIIRMLEPVFGPLKPLRLNVRRVTDLQTKLVKDGLKPASVNRVTETVKAILNYSAQQGRIPYNPASGLKKLRVSKAHIQFWEQEEAESFLDFASKKYPPGSDRRWVYLVYLLCLNTGLRAGEVWGLQARDLVQGGSLIAIRRQYDRVERIMRDTKGRNQRHVPCNVGLLRELQAFLERDPRRADDPLFQSEEGTPICHDNFKKRIFDEDMTESKLKPIRFHDLRHTAATLMIARGLVPTVVQEIMGHESITTTMIYVHLLGSSIQDAAKLFSLSPKARCEITSAPLLRVVG